MLDVHPGPFRQNGERVREKPRMTKEEVRVMLKALFQFTDEATVDIVWEEMEEIRKKKDEGEC